MPQSDALVKNVDDILKALRKKLLEIHPDDVLKSLPDAVKQLEKDNEPGDSCSKIIPKMSDDLTDRSLTFVILGASGDLAKKKTFPALFQLYCEGLIPLKVNIIGYARTETDDVEKWKHETLAKNFTHLDTEGCHVDEFLARVSYVSGKYDSEEDFKKLADVIAKKEQEFDGDQKGGNRLFYLALPPNAFLEAATSLRRHVMPEKDAGWARIIVEKPFGRDLESSNKLAKDLKELFDEEQIFRIDHYLGKEMVQNILTTRFANRIFNAVWDAKNIACVQITFKETIGTEGRGGYFDNFGIIRDVMQNHLTQVLALIGMEKPQSLDAESIRDAKVKLLQCVSPVTVEDCVLGQYTASEDGSIPGYLEDEKVPNDSKSPTFAILRLKINNERWAGVPFILKAGKALEEKYVGIRIQFKEEEHPFEDAAKRNELVIRAQPSEAIYMKITAKEPGLKQNLKETHQTELDLTYRKRYDVRLPDAYENLISDALRGQTMNFVRTDELTAAWEIFTPLLHKIDEGKVPVIPYQAGTRGPKEADQFILDSNFKYEEGYHWVAGKKEKFDQ